MRLADLYDGDLRVRDLTVALVAQEVSIPHPLHGIEYGDGVDRCTHAKRCTTVLGEPAR